MGKKTIIPNLIPEFHINSTSRLTSIATLAVALGLAFFLPTYADEATGVSDNISISIDTICSFISGGSNSASNDDLTFQGTAWGAQPIVFSNNGIHNFRIICNEPNGYTVRAYATNLIFGSEYIPFVNYADYDEDSSSAAWTAQVTDGNDDAIFGPDEDNTTIIKSTAAISSDAGEPFSVTYKAHASLATVAGTYTGNAVYTIIPNLIPGYDQIPPMADGMTMQFVAANHLCKSDGEEKEYRLIDNRTGKYYTIRKMKDGNCWMVQNLWLAANTEYTAADGTTKFNTGSSVTSGWGTGQNNTSVFYEGEHLAGTTTASSDAANYGSNSNRGSFFNWKLATAGTGGGYNTNQAATTSVCPQGWKLPTGDSGADFAKLYTTAYSG